MLVKVHFVYQIKNDANIATAVHPKTYAHGPQSAIVCWPTLVDGALGMHLNMQLFCVWLKDISYCRVLHRWCVRYCILCDNHYDGDKPEWSPTHEYA